MYFTVSVESKNELRSAVVKARWFVHVSHQPPTREQSPPLCMPPGSVKSLSEGSHKMVSPIQRLWRCLFFCTSWSSCLSVEQGIKYIYSETSSLHAVPPDCLQSMEELLTTQPASNCLQRAAPGTGEAGKTGNFKTQPLWPQEKMHAAVDAVCLPIPLHQDTVQIWVTCLHAQGILQTQPGLDTSSKHKAVVHCGSGWPACYCSGLDSRENLCSIIGPLSFRQGLMAWSNMTWNYCRHLHCI